MQIDIYATKRACQEERDRKIHPCVSQHKTTAEKGFKAS